MCLAAEAAVGAVLLRRNDPKRTARIVHSAKHHLYTHAPNRSPIQAGQPPWTYVDATASVGPSTKTTMPPDQLG